MIRILVDSSSDYEMRELAEKGIEIIPITISIGGNVYADGVDLSHEDFYKLLESSEEFPKTAQPSPADFTEIFEDVKEKKDEMVCILLSSAFSGTCQSANIAKEMVGYSGIHIIDSLSAASAIKIMADYACRLRDSGASAEEIAANVEKMKSRVKIIASVDTLEYLYRGGRLSRASSVIGNTIGLKPVITVTTDGCVKVTDKQIGKMRAMDSVIKYIIAQGMDESFPLYSVWSLGTENSEQFEQRLEKNGLKISDRIRIGPTIGAHTGPGVFGAIFVAKEAE